MEADGVERQVQRSLDRDAVAVAVVQLAATCEPDGQDCAVQGFGNKERQEAERHHAVGPPPARRRA